LITLSIVAAAVTVASLASYYAQHRNDQYQLILLGKCLNEGGRMYTDCWENKPPGIAWLNALGLLIYKREALGTWMLPGLVTYGCLATLAWTAFRVFGLRIGFLATMLAVVVATLRAYDAPSINPDFYSSMFALAGASLILRAVGWSTGLAPEPNPATVPSVTVNPPSPIRIVALGLASGLFFGAAVLVKQTGLLGLVCLTAGAIVPHSGTVSYRRRWIPFAAAWLAVVVELGTAVSVLFHQQTVGLAWEAVMTFNRYLLTWDHLTESLGSWRRAMDGLWSMQLPLWLAAIGIISTASRGFRQGHQPVNIDPHNQSTIDNRQSTMAPGFRSMIIGLVAWWLVEVFFALTGPSYAMRYWQGTFPPMLWLAAFGLHLIGQFLDRLDSRHRWAATIVAVTAVAFLAKPLVDEYRHGLASSYLAYSDGDPERTRLREIGRVIQEQVPPDERIYVMAYDAGVYVYADRLPASRFTYPRSKEQMDEILADLAGAKPRAVLVPPRPAEQFEMWCDDGCVDRIKSFDHYQSTSHNFGQWQLYLKKSSSLPIQNQ